MRSWAADSGACSDTRTTVFAAALALTSGALAALHALADPARAVEVTVLVLANAVATALRFLLLRRWVFAAASTTPSTTREETSR